MTRPLVSVITTTWQRPELLSSAIENVQAQSYRPLEHVIISDGPDRETARVAVGAVECGDPFDSPASQTPSGQPDADVLVRYVPLGRNWTTFLPDSFAAAAMIVGSLVAAGDYQCWLPDDDRMTPDHVETLVSALEVSSGDFAYGPVRMYRRGQTPEQGYVIGGEPPQYGQITNCLYRTDLLKRGLYPVGRGFASDWACIEQWLRAGATWAYVDRVTLTHRIDH